MTHSSDQLAQLEELLVTVAQSNAASTERLGRVEAILAENARQLAETWQIVDSNARVIRAWVDRNEEVQVDTEEAPSSTKADLAVQMEDNAHNHGVDRVRFDQLHEQHSQRFKDLLEEAKADRQRADRLHAEHNQRFNNLLEEARADRQRADRDRALNESEHRTARQTFQTMLALIVRLRNQETDQVHSEPGAD